MANDLRTSGGHSAEYFGASRDYWWNDDFLDLMATRWALSEVTRALDVGCGVGHWGRCLLPRIAPRGTILGVDPDPQWPAEASARAEAAQLADRLLYEPGRVEALPLASDTFDLVTCQTVLIHVPDPQAALLEMVRVARPGGLIAVAEPNNLANALVLDSSLRLTSPEVILELARFQLICERGKAALGLGDNSVGEQLPALFQRLGLEDVRVYLNDRTNPILPPYEDPSARASVDELRDWSQRDVWIWGAEETRRYFEAGGGAPEAFDAQWTRARQVRQHQADAITAGSYHSAGGGLTYLVSGRKPTARQ